MKVHRTTVNTALRNAPRGDEVTGVPGIGGEKKLWGVILFICPIACHEGNYQHHGQNVHGMFLR